MKLLFSIFGSISSLSSSLFLLLFQDMMTGLSGWELQDQPEPRYGPTDTLGGDSVFSVDS